MKVGDLVRYMSDEVIKRYHGDQTFINDPLLQLLPINKVGVILREPNEHGQWKVAMPNGRIMWCWLHHLEKLNVSVNL